MALIATEPVVKAPFVENCMHTRLMVNVMQNDSLASFIENCMHMRLMVSVMQNDPLASFIENCMHTRLMGQCNAKWPISLVLFAETTAKCNKSH